MVNPVHLPCGHCDGTGSKEAPALTKTLALVSRVWLSTRTIALAAKCKETAMCNRLADLRKLGLVERRGGGSRHSLHEWRRKASLIETHTRVAKAGHCIHCGETYAEHDSDEKRRKERPDGLLPKKLANPAIDKLRCLALQRLFESVELDTYQPLPMAEVDLGQ